MIKHSKAVLMLVSFVAASSTGLFAAPSNPVTDAKDSTVNVSPNPSYKVGNPYEVLGVKYEPKEDYNYDAVGIASWYGKDFHGNLTSNGEVFDMAELTAAHPTLPLPSFVEVTNLDNGKRLIVRVNDRGPFVSGRIIDLSKRSAELLGFQDKGTAKVRVRVIPDISKEVAEKLMADQMKNYADSEILKPEENKVAQAPQATKEPEEVLQDAISNIKVSSEPVDGNMIASEPSVNTLVDIDDPASNRKLDNLISDRTSQQVPVGILEPDTFASSSVPKGVFVQVGAFSNSGKIPAIISKLDSMGVITVQKLDFANSSLVRVRVGPFVSIEDANNAKRRIVDLGYDSARVVIEQ